MKTFLLAIALLVTTTVEAQSNRQNRNRNRDSGEQNRNQQVIKFETIGARNTGSPAGFCVKSVSESAFYESIQNNRGLRQYECQVPFVGTDRANNRDFNGSRVMSYRAVPVITERRELRRQEDYLRELEDSDQMMGYVAIPNSVYRALPNVSREREERRLEAQAYALIPSDGSFQAAIRAACYIALLEALDNACSPEDLNEIRASIERKIESLNGQGRATEYSGGAP
jgi:hypothetical protein